MHIIGRGGFGKVWKVKLKKTNEYFALKEMSKTKIIDRRSEISIMSERTLLSKLSNPFIVNMYFAFQDYSNLYLVMDLLSGGDLRYHLVRKKKFTEKETKFFISNIILALEYIHSKNIIHRDIKPENLVLEYKGYLRLTDFSVAKINEKDNSNETSGTPGYMAPEVMLVQNHSFPSDFFALGVIGYEFMLGFRPYLGRSRKEIKELIIYKQAKLNESDVPYSWSIESADFINKLLKRKPNKRLGFNGIKELKNHKWMRDINWTALKRKELVAPFIPNSNRENFDKHYCEKQEDIGRATLSRYKQYTESVLFKDAFKGYTYININYLQFKFNKFKNKNKENKEENDKKNNIENKKAILIKTPNSRMRKSNSMIFDDKKTTNSYKSDKIINNLNLALNLYKMNKNSQKSQKNLKENDKNKDIIFKRLTVNNNSKSRKKNNKKLEQKKVMNKSNSMKILNINLSSNKNINKNFGKTNNNKNENKTKKINNTNNIKTVDKKNIIMKNNYNAKKPEIFKSSFAKIFSPKYFHKKEIKSNSVLLNYNKKEDKEKDEINEKNKKTNESNKLNNLVFSNDFNLIEFSKDNYNEPRSKVMLWIQRSHPINQYENNNNENNTNDKIIKDRINRNQSHNKEEVSNFKKTDKIIQRKLDINKIIRTSKNNNNKKYKYYKSLIMDTNGKYRTKKIINKRQLKSSSNSKRNFHQKNKNSSNSVHIEKSTLFTKSINSKTPKNTFLVFNTININLGNNQKEQKRIKTPKAQVIRNINSSLKDAYLKNDFIFGSFPYFTKKEEDKYKINNSHKKRYINIMKNYQNKNHSTGNIEYNTNI